MNLSRLIGVYRIAQPCYDAADLATGAAAAEPAAEPAAAPDFAAFEAAENAADVILSEPGKVTSTATEATPAAATATAETTPAAAATTTTTQPDKGYTPPKAGSRRSEKDQAHVNEVIRKATEAAQAEAAKNVEELRKELANLRAKTTPAAEPAAQTKAAPAIDPNDPKPTEAEFDEYGDFIEARAAWKFRQIEREKAAAEVETRTREAATVAQREASERLNAWNDRRDAFYESNPDRKARIEAFLDQPHVSSGTPIGDSILYSEVGPEVADYLSAHPEQAARIGALPPLSAILAMGKLEATLSSPTTSASASAGPAARTVTQAPAPPTTLAARSADVADPIAAAIAGGNYLAFEAEENRRDALRH